MPLFTRRRLFAGLGVIGAGAGFGAYKAAPFRYYEGPLTDHFDGTHFLDQVHSTPPKSTGEVLRWYMDRTRAQWPAWNASPFDDKPPRRVDDRTWRISYVGHA